MFSSLKLCLPRAPQSVFDVDQFACGWAIFSCLGLPLPFTVLIYANGDLSPMQHGARKYVSRILCKYILCVLSLVLLHCFA